MTNLLAKGIKAVKMLPKKRQDAAGELLLSLAQTQIEECTLDHTPNKVTRAALAELRDTKKRARLPVFSSVEELLADLLPKPRSK
ncbi:MAG: hypothetical protein Q7S26_00325 [bacterium]|nr:hypothetical protein [bacterium]